MIIFVFNGQGQREESRTTTRHQLEMASAMIKSSFRSALRVGASRGTPAFKRTFASSAHHDEAREAAKWEKITYVGIITCTVLAIVNLSKGHPHHEEPPVSFIYAFLVPSYMSKFVLFSTICCFQSFQFGCKT
uniref:Cytochrome c oxidase subunit 6a, mitochondrial n=1 Tax=Nicotiana tabacum TaxID=4097 RepID=A0A1S3Y8B1_TOBAC|nr:PREDICTED: cytochrome c oxidase subunit 6a, mitochondrial-like [Nicotiana tabacum]